MLVVAFGIALAACGISVVGASADGGGTSRDASKEATSGGGDDSQGVDGAIEGGAPVGTDAGCPAVCTGGCKGGTCSILCANGTHCPKVTCPPGMPCEVTCIGYDSCTKGVDCTQATSCNITCDTTANPQDPGACHDVDCSGTACTLTCAGEKACQQRLSCDAGSCNVTCGTKEACCTAPICNGCSVGGASNGVGGC